MLLQNVPLIFLEVCDALGLVDLASLCAVGVRVALLLFQAAQTAELPLISGQVFGMACFGTEWAFSATLASEETNVASCACDAKASFFRNFTFGILCVMQRCARASPASSVEYQHPVREVLVHVYAKKHGIAFSISWHSVRVMPRFVSMFTCKVLCV